MEKDIEILKDDFDFDLTIKIKHICDYIHETIRECGDISQFKEDVMYVIHELLDKQIRPQELTACEMLLKREQYRIQQLREEKYEKHIKYLELEIEKQEKIIEKLAEHIDYYTYKGGENSYDMDYGCDFQLQTKCVCEDEKDCKECIINWARKEVENENTK